MLVLSITRYQTWRNSPGDPFIMLNDSACISIIMEASGEFIFLPQDMMQETRLDYFMPDLTVSYSWN